MLQACLKRKSLHFKERPKNLLLRIKFRKDWLLTLIRCCYPILLQVILHLSSLVRNKCLLRERKKENKSLVLLVLLLQVIFCLCSSFTLGRLNATILKESHFQIDLTCHTQKTIGATKPWLSSTLITSSFCTLKWYVKS